MLGNPVLREFGYRVPAASFALAGCFATGRKTCSAKPHSDSPSHSRRKRTCRPPRCSASPSRRRGTGGIASRIDIPCHLCQRLSSGIKETVLRDRTEFPVKHVQLLDQEPPSQREFPWTRCTWGCRVGIGSAWRFKIQSSGRRLQFGSCSAIGFCGDPRRLPVGRRQAAATWFFWHGSCNPIAISRAHSGEYIDQIAKGALCQRILPGGLTGHRNHQKQHAAAKDRFRTLVAHPMPGVVKDRRACRSAAAESADAGQPQPPQPDTTLSGGTKAPSDGG
jgi:hypothetical protein